MSILTRRIGDTDVFVSQISFGCASIGNLYRQVSDADVAVVLEQAWQAGIRYFDTAPHYGRGLSEQRLGRFLREKSRRDYALSTKVGRVLSPGLPMREADGFASPLPNAVHYDYSAQGIDASLQGSFERLGTDYINIVYVHDIGAYTHGAENTRHMQAFMDSGYDHLLALKREGRIGAIGLGVNENQVCIDIMQNAPLDVILLAGRWSLLDRSAEATLTGLCTQTGTSLVLGGIFNSGILATGAREGATYDYGPASDDVLNAVRALEAKAQSLDLTLPQAAILFAKTRPGVASVLVGTASQTTLDKNLAAFELAVPDGFNNVFG